MFFISLLKNSTAESIMRGVLALVGYTFVLTGGLALADEILDAQQSDNLVAQLCTTLNCTTDPLLNTNTEPIVTSGATETATPGTAGSLTDTVNTSLTTPTTTDTTITVAPIVRFHEIPQQTIIGRDTPVAISLIDAHHPSVFLVSPTHGTRREVTSQQSSNGRFYYLLPTASALSGEYFVWVEVTALNGTTKANFSSSHFVVPRPTTSTEIVSPTSPSPAPTTAPVTAVASTTNTITPTVTTTATATDPISAPLSLRSRSGATTNTFEIRTEGGGLYSRIELYLRNTVSTGSTFLGLATRTNQGYVYWLDASRVPVGTYVVLAQARRDGIVVETAETRITTERILETPAVIAATEVEAETIKQSVVSQATVAGEPDVFAMREDYVIATPATTPSLKPVAVRPVASPDTTEVATTSTAIQAATRELLSERQEQLNVLFIRHASAIQTGDATMRRLSEEAIDNELKLLGTDVDTDTKAELQRTAKLEIEKIKDKIEVTENLLRLRTKDKSATDTDRDGISDFDEVTIYRTNAKDSDTDRDGILDSIELMRGFDPSNAKTEAVVNFASPKDLGYTNEAVLKVEKVIPVLSHQNEVDTPAVHSEIRGFALPDSFVTLYIFSTPTVVTLRTNSDGSFAYVFEKELEDGEHEVYVALTDNTGDIVVKSNPFSFVKTAQAFTYEDETAATVTNYEAPAVAKETSQAFMITILMSIVTLGVILVLLGQMLRTRRSDEFA